MNSLKELFRKDSVVQLERVTKEDLAVEIESEEYIDSHEENIARVVPDVDFSDPKNFAKFGLAERYYLDAIKHIYNTFPYDGSKKERTEWDTSASYLERYILENDYPRFNGYAIFRTGSYVTSTSSNGYASPAVQEYILTKGGPGLGKTNSYFENNKYDFDKQRECNLRIGSENTVEFYLKKAAFSSSIEVVFDAWTTSSISSSADYGRLRIELDNTASATPWRVSWMSGTSGFEALSIGSSNLTTASVANNTWTHYSFRFWNSGSTPTVDLFIDGEYNATSTGSTSVSYVSGTVVSTIGALCVAPSGNNTVQRGWGPLSGSVDEFRFWKNKRTAKEIKRHYNNNVYGGTNTDDANTELGLYYKFNEGITTTSSYDSIVLDFSGRVSNGSWTGYQSGNRNTGSAFVNDYREPTIYSNHPDVVALLEEKKLLGREWDDLNGNSLHKSIPSYIVEESETYSQEDNEQDNLVALTQVIASYFDSLEQNLKEIPKIHAGTYSETTTANKPFYKNLLSSADFEMPDIFENASVYEYFNNRNEEENFEEKLSEIKNTVYQNIYNNLVHIYKSKGTEKSFRNLLRCFGVDDQLYKLNVYAKDAEFEFKDNFSSVSQYKKYFNFNTVENSDATVFGYYDSSDTNTKTYISGTQLFSGTREDSGLALLFEADVLFPKRYGINEYNTYLSGTSAYSKTYPLLLTSSLFGVHTAKDDQTDLTWNSNDYANFSVTCIKDNLYSDRGYFKLSGSLIGEVTSSWVDNLYSDSRWNVAVNIYPAGYPYSFIASGSSGYVVELYGISYILDEVQSSFSASTTITTTNGQRFLSSHKRPYLGAHRTNFTGSVIAHSDVKISDMKVSFRKLSEQEKVDYRDVSSDGISNPAKSTFMLDTLSGSFLPKTLSTVLHWNADKVTGSNSSGEFSVYDQTSGSSKIRGEHDWFGNILGYQHSAKGYDFSASSTEVVKNEYLISAKKELPEFVHSSDLVRILSKDDIHFDITKRLSSYFMLVEKSMYSLISEQMLKMFATVKDFDSILGNPANRYRQNYKELDNLRTIFFEKVGNIPDLEKFTEYFKWLDTTVGYCLRKVMPASSDLSEEDVKNVVESHIFERNKIVQSFPFLKETRKAAFETSIIGSKELEYNWKFGNGTTNGCLWKELRSRQGDPLVDATYSHNSSSGVILSGSNGPYTGSLFEQRYFTDLVSIRSDSDASDSKNIHFVLPKMVSATGSEEIGFIIDLGNTGSAVCADYADLGRKEVVKNVAFYPIGSENDKILDKNIPFKVYSGSTTNEKYTGIHRDIYGDEKDEPIQSVWTQRFVGGNPTRQFGLANPENETQESNRPEKFYLVETGSQVFIYSPKKYNKHANVFFRDYISKQIVSFKNVPMSTSSVRARTFIGNYQFNYEVLNIVGRTNNNRSFVKSGSLGAISGAYSTAISGVIDFEVPQRTKTDTYQNFVIVERFAHLPSPEVSSDGYLDYESGEYSVYNSVNNRNLIVRQALDSQSSQVCGQFGYDSSIVGILLPSTMTGTYENSASYHKVYRNRLERIELSGSVEVDAEDYDNLFVTRAIPRSEIQYLWISQSLSNFLSIEFEDFGYQQPNFAYADKRSTSFPNNVSGANLTSGSAIFLANKAIADTVNFGSRLLEPFDPSGKLPNPATNTEKLYALNLYRNGNVGWPTWKQTRRNSLLQQGEDKVPVLLFDKDDDKYVFAEPKYTQKYKNILIKTKLKEDAGKEVEKYISVPFGNNFVKVSDQYQYNINVRQFFNEVYTNNTFGKIFDIVKDNSDELYYSEQIYPREQFVGLTRTRTNFLLTETSSWQNDFWRTQRVNRRSIQLSFGLNYTSSIWPLDARYGFSLTSSYSATSSAGKQGEGLLQNNNTIFHIGNKSNLYPGPLYAHRIEETVGGTKVYSGDTEWEVSSQNEPFRDTYAEFVEDVKNSGKDYSVIPEYRVSEHVSTYLVSGALATIDGYLTLTGSQLSSSTSDAFYKKYSTTELLKYFNIFSDEVSKEGFNPSRLKLTAKAKIKLHPYNGFYPAQRTAQLVSLFSESYGGFITVTGADSSSPAAIRPVMQPLFTPGILFNTIKAGLAVDYPIYVSGGIAITGSTANSTQDNGIPRLDTDFDYRVPFEAIVEPDSYLKGLRIVDQEPHPSASLNVTASLNGAGSEKYKLAANNFFAESINMFLKDGSLTTISSLPDSDPNFGVVTAGKKYMMRFVCSHSKYRQYAEIVDQVSVVGIQIYQSQSYEWNPPTITLYKNIGSGSGYTNSGSVYGAAFGPPVNSSLGLVTPGLSSSAAYYPFTPPYYGGYSDVKLTFAPTASGKVSVETILSQLTASSSRLDVLYLSAETAEDNKMQLSASINLFQKVVEKTPVFDSNGNLIQVDSNGQSVRWVVQPKFETPILDFSNASVTTPISGAAGISRGMWHQYGQIPTSSNQGLFLEVQDLRQDELGDVSLTGSLADLVGFKKEGKKLGQLRKEFKMKEAIVAVPFYTDIYGKEQYYTIPKKIIENAQLFINGQKDLYELELKDNSTLRPSDAIIEMVRKMKEFVLPPKFDFISNKTIEPMAMYIFDFDVTLSQTDLSKIWQNTAPESTFKFVDQEKTVEHDLTQFAGDEFGLIGDIKQNIQWLVFKVKQKAGWNYFAKTADTNDDIKFNFKNGNKNSVKEFEPEISYNWPYDFCSIIESGRLEAEIKMSREQKEPLPNLEPNQSAEDHSQIIESLLDPYQDMKGKI